MVQALLAFNVLHLLHKEVDDLLQLGARLLHSFHQIAQLHQLGGIDGLLLSVHLADGGSEAVDLLG